MEINIARLNRLGNLGTALDRLERLAIAIGVRRASDLTRHGHRYRTLQRAYSRTSLSRIYLGSK